MAVSKEYTNEELNYFRICYITTDILAEGLREIFKQEWDNRYKSTLRGEWIDDPRNGMDFYNAESPKTRKRNAHLLTTMKNGDRGEWDCTMLFYALLYSDCVGSTLNATVSNTLDDLRKFRNAVAHIKQGKLCDKDFHTESSKVHAAFQALGLPTVRIQEIKNQKTFPTEELRKILKDVSDLKHKLQEKEDQLQEKEDQRSGLEYQLLKDAPAFCILPPKPSHDIGSRDREVTKLTKRLRELKEANVNRLSYLYISGNPGSGKSQLAGLVANRFFEETKELPDVSSFVMTLNATSHDSLLESYTSFARQLKCPDYSVMKIHNSKDFKVEDKISHLKMLVAPKVNLYTSWLLVVDNVTNLTSINDSLPESGNQSWGKGQLLITTQDTAAIPLEDTFINHISVSKGMEPEDATLLLAKLSGITDIELEEKVAEKLDYQPLALASAAIYIKEIRQAKASKDFGWSEYLKKIEEGKRNTTELTLAQTNPIYPNTMTKSITLAVETQSTCDKVVYHLFNFLSLCAPQPINLRIAVDYVAKNDDTDKEQISSRIRRCSLLLLEEDENSCFIRVHQVVHDAIKFYLMNKEGQHQDVVNGTIKEFNQFIANISPENGTLETIHIVPHLKALFHNVSKEGTVPQVYDEGILIAFANFGQTCETHCEFNVAKRFFEQLSCVEKRTFGTEHVDVATTYNSLGSVHMKLGDFEAAKEYHKHALTILEKLDAEHVVAKSYNYLGLTHRKLSDFQQAKECHQQALAILKNLGTAESVEAATSYYHLGEIHIQLDDFQQAMQYHQRALELYIKTFGTKHHYIATSYTSLGEIHRQLDDFQQAKKYHQSALAICLEKLGAEHIDVASIYDRLATLQSQLGDFQESSEYYQRALKIRLKTLGVEHVNVATTYNNIGINLWKQGNFEQAKENIHRAVDISVKKLGFKHDFYAISHNNLGYIHMEQGHFEQAKENHHRALEILVEKYGSEHVHIATIHNNIGLCERRLGNFERAKEYHQHALNIFLKKRGAEHVDVAKTYNNLGAVHLHLGDLKHAMEYHQHALDIYVQKFGTEHGDVADTYNHLGSVHSQLGDFETAKDHHQRALDIYVKTCGAEYVHVADVYNNLGAIHGKRGEFEQAKDYHQRALDIYVKKLGAVHVDVTITYDYLGEIQRQLGGLVL